MKKHKKTLTNNKTIIIENQENNTINLIYFRTDFYVNLEQIVTLDGPINL